MTADEEEAMGRELMRLTVRELRALAREEGVRLGYASRKADVVREIVGHRAYMEYTRGEEQE